MPANLPAYTEHRGITIADYRLVAHLTCPFVISLPGFGPLGARTLDEAHAKIEDYLAYRERPAQPGELKIVGVMPGQRAMKASTMRQRAERARGARRTNGRFS